MEPDSRGRWLRPMVFDKMEGLVRELQDSENGVRVRSQRRLFLATVPSAFMGYDLIGWLIERLGIEESEALNIANQLCQYGYIFPVSDSRNLTVKDDSSLYRFQSPYYWPWQNRPPDNVEYAIYLIKRSLRNNKRHDLDDYELEMLGSLKRNLANKWDFITMQAEEQGACRSSSVPNATHNSSSAVLLARGMSKRDKKITDSQEKAYWRVHRPPPGAVSPLEPNPVPTRCRNGSRTRKITLEDCQREVELVKNSLLRTRIKVSQALESMVQHVETYAEYDPIITGTQPSNPWVSEDCTFWQQNNSLVETPTEKRVRRWGLSVEELVSDPTGLQEFTNYLRKEYSHENIRFWMAVNDLRRSAQSQIQRKVKKIFEEFLAPGAPCEINIDGKTMEKVHQEMRSPSRFTFDAAQEHVYTLLLKKDCYPRFIRSEQYKNLLAAGNPPSQKKRFFNFGQGKKKASTSNAPNPALLQQQASQGVSAGALSRRRGSDRSLSGSAHELAVSGVRDTKVPHSHSQSNLSDIPYRGDLPCQSKASTAPIQCPAEVSDEQEGTDPESACRVKKPSIAVIAGTSTSEDVYPWDAAPEGDSGGSSSEISQAVIESSDRLRRTCALTQQKTLDSDHKGQTRKLSTISYVEQRRASISVPLKLPERPSVSSVEDCSNSVDTAPAPSDTDNKIEEIPSDKTVKKSSSLTKTCSVTGANAPIISVSSVADDTVPEEVSIHVEEQSSSQPSVPLAVPSSSQSSSPLAEPSSSQPLAPLAEPDGESPVSEVPPEPTPEEAKSNPVCPWEDEETCKVDAPFVKTYATLGYL